MVTGKISFSASLDLDGDCSFTVIAAKSGLHTHTRFWGEPDALQRFGKELVQFPIKATDRVRFEVGRLDYQHYPYLLLEAFCYSPLGQAAIKVIAVNGENEPGRQHVEFSIPAEAASINKLGQMLLSWDVDHSSVIQMGSASRLRTSLP